jgi:twinkle protein
MSAAVEEVVGRLTESCRIVCPICSETRKKKNERSLSVTVKSDVTLYNCHHCNAEGGVQRKSYSPPISRQRQKVTVPKTTDLSLIGEYLESRSINPLLAEKYGLASAPRMFREFGEQDAIGFVYDRDSDERAVKWRSLKSKAWTQQGAARTFYGIEFVEDNPDTLVICEGEMDVLALATAGITAVSCPNGAPSKVSNRKVHPEEDKKFSYLWEERELLEKVEKIVLATDDDPAGEALAEELARRIPDGRAKCWRVHYPRGCKDSNDVLIKHSADKLKHCIENPTPLPLKGIYTAQEYMGAVEDIYSKGLGGGVSTGIKSLDDLFTIAAGQLSVVTGLPSSGKSEFVDQLMVNLAMRESWKFAVASFENPPHFHISKLAEKITGKSFHQGSANRMSKQEMQGAYDFINDHFVFLDSKDGVVSSVDSIIARCKASILRMGVRGLVIDPYNFIEQGEGEEHLSINAMLTKITTFAKAHDLHVWFVAHPTKVYPNDKGEYPVVGGNHISGSAAWFAKADVGITVHRSDESTDIHCWKMRFKWLGKQGAVPLSYDVVSGRYSDYVDQTYAGVSEGHWSDDF